MSWWKEIKCAACWAFYHFFCKEFNKKLKTKGFIYHIVKPVLIAGKTNHSFIKFEQLSLYNCTITLDEQGYPFNSFLISC